MSVRIDTTKLDPQLFYNVTHIAIVLASRRQKVTLIVRSCDRKQFNSFTLIERAYIDFVGPGVIESKSGVQ